MVGGQSGITYMFGGKKRETCMIADMKLEHTYMISGQSGGTYIGGGQNGTWNNYCMVSRENGCHRRQQH